MTIRELTSIIKNNPNFVNIIIHDESIKENIWEGVLRNIPEKFMDEECVFWIPNFTNPTSTIVIHQEVKIRNFEFSIVTTGKYIYMMDEFQQAVCDEGDVETIANEIFDGIDCEDLEDIEMTKFERDDEYLTLWVEGYFNTIEEGEDEKSAYDKAIHAWEEADFGVLEDLEVED